MNNQSNPPDAPAAIPNHRIAKFVLHQPSDLEGSPKVKLWTQIPKSSVAQGYYVCRTDETMVVFVEGYVARQDLVCMKLLTPDYQEHASQTMTSGIFHAMFTPSNIYH